MAQDWTSAQKPAPPRSDGLLYTAAAVIMVAIVGIIGWTLWHRIPAGKSADSTKTNASLAPNPGGSDYVNAEQPIPDFVGPIRPEPTPRTQAPASRPTKLSAPSAPPASGVAPVAPAGAAGRTAAGRAAPEDGRATTASGGAGAAPSVRPRVTGLTYSAADADVSPPAAISPQLVGMLSQSSPGIRQAVMTIAVIVNEHGTVDSVKAVNEPESLGESVMLTAALSAVKSWKFRPAMKDGAPVRYRQIVPLRIAVPVP